MVDNVCILGFADKIKPIAVVVPEQRTLRNFVVQNGIGNQHADLAGLVGNDKIKDAILKDLLSAAKAAGLQGIELVSGVVIAHEPWTPENGMVTAAMKLSRRNIEKVYADEIQVYLQLKSKTRNFWLPRNRNKSRTSAIKISSIKMLP
jgi:long-chain acyl-CoA synthetase